MTPLRALIGVVGLALVAGCGNDPRLDDRKSLARALFEQVNITRETPTGTAVSQDALARVLSATSNSVILLTVEDTKSQAPLIEISQNLSHRTYATGTRQSVTFKDGFLTATRGLGGDVMSSKIDQSSALVRSRTAGLAKREMRFLTGDNQTIIYNFDCVISVDAAQDGMQGMREDCRDGALTLINTYVVDQSGIVRASRQWLGTLNGFATFVLLRD